MSGLWWIVGTCLIWFGLCALAFVAVCGGGILTRRHDEAAERTRRQRAVAAAALGQDGDVDPAACDCEDGDDLLDVWEAAAADPDRAVADSGLAGEVEGWLRDVTVGVTPPVIRPAAPPREDR